MKKRLLVVVALAMASSASLFAQSSEGLTQQEVSGTEHVGTWKLVKQKIVFADGKVHIGDSSNVFQRKILDRKSTRLNSSHVKISYAVFCLNKRHYGAERELIVR